MLISDHRYECWTIGIWKVILPLHHFIFLSSILWTIKTLLGQDNRSDIHIYTYIVYIYFHVEINKTSTKTCLLEIFLMKRWKNYSHLYNMCVDSLIMYFHSRPKTLRSQIQGILCVYPMSQPNFINYFKRIDQLLSYSSHIFEISRVGILNLLWA